MVGKPKMWFHIRAKDMRLDKPNGIVIEFWLWANNKKDLDDMLSKKQYIKEIEWIKEEIPPFVN